MCVRTYHGFGGDKCRLVLSCLRQCSDLIYLILLASVHGLWIGGRSQPELRITEVSVSVHVVQTFPDDLLLCQEALVCDEEVQLTLGQNHTDTDTAQHHTGHTYGLRAPAQSIRCLVCDKSADERSQENVCHEALSEGYRRYAQLCLRWHPSSIIPNRSKRAPLPLLRITGKAYPSCGDMVNQLWPKRWQRWNADVYVLKKHCCLSLKLKHCILSILRTLGHKKTRGALVCVRVEGDFCSQLDANTRWKLFHRAQGACQSRSLAKCRQK